MIALLLALAHAADDPTEVVVEGDRPERTASEATLDQADVQALPGRSTDDLLRAMPGLHQSAHGGHGKAYQYFLRGFDAVHGADIAVDIDGVPVNEPSNVHAHGYLDLHLVPRALVRSVVLRPGTPYADAGDFAVAGSASFGLGLDRPGVQTWLGAGTDLSAAASVGWRPADPGTFVVADVDLGRGAGMSRAWRQLRAGAGVHGTLDAVDATAWVLAYDGVFESPGVLRDDDVEDGTVGFYDAYPGSGGGRSSRIVASGRLAGGTARFAWRALAWGSRRDLALRQNFTGFQTDPVHGDGQLQTHGAWSGGARVDGGWHPSPRVAVTGGVATRVDAFAQAEQGVDTKGLAYETRSTVRARQASVGAWASAPLALGWLRVEPGVRAEAFFVDEVDGDAAWAPVLAPKLLASAFDDGPVTIFAAYGRGFRSPDARGAGTGRAPVALSDSGELGVCARPGSAVELRAAGFATVVSDEIVFDHAAARYLATGATRRLGVEGGVTVRPIDGVRVESVLTWTDGRYTTTGDPIPYAPRLLVVGGVYTDHVPVGPTALTVGVRAWALGPRSLPGGFASRPTGAVDLVFQVDRDAWSVAFDMDNVLGTRWRDGEFLFPSWWDTSTPRGELPARHITAGTAPVARLSLGRRF